MGAVAAAAMGLGNSEKILFGAGRRLMSRGIPAFQFGGFVRDARARLGALDGGEQVFNEGPGIHGPSSPFDLFTRRVFPGARRALPCFSLHSFPSSAGLTLGFPAGSPEKT